MGRVLPIGAAVARKASPASGVDALPDAGAISASGSEWFFEAAITICGTKDPGYQLHLFTGWAVTSCRYYVARDQAQRRKPPVEFLRVLFHSPHGEPFFRAFMHGCDAAWWREQERARLDSVLLRKLVDDVTNRD